MSSATTPARRVVVLSDRATTELARTLTAAGLEVRTGGDPSAPDVVLADPHCIGTGSLESVIAGRAGALLARCGDAVPALHDEVMRQAELGLFKAVLAHTCNHLGRASKILGLDRNTCARKARAFGLVVEPSRGRKPKVAKAKVQRTGRGRKKPAAKKAGTAGCRP